MRTIPAPHAALNGAPEALALVHSLVARRVEAMIAEIERQPDWNTEIDGWVYLDTVYSIKTRVNRLRYPARCGSPGPLPHDVTPAVLRV